MELSHLLDIDFCLWSEIETQFCLFVFPSCGLPAVPLFIESEFFLSSSFIPW